MKLDFLGRLDKVRVPKSQPLLPVFEAISNSIHAIEESKNRGGGRIRVRVCRDQRQPRLPAVQDRSPRQITGFVIEDNGQGFTDQNFDTFDTSDSRLKAARGGKGIGRLHWLKVFERAQVESTFRGADGWCRRRFDFIPAANPIANQQVEPIKSGSLTTRVNLLGPNPDYLDRMPKTGDAIARRIIEHFLVYFLSPDCPRVTCDDDEEDESIDLNERFEQMKTSAATDSFRLKQYDFRMQYLMIRSGDPNDHAAHFCASQRPVLSTRLASLVPDLRNHVLQRDGTRCALVALVSGLYLDQRVNEHRTEFDIPEAVDEAEMFDPSRSEIDTAVSEKVAAYLRDDLEEFARERIAQITAFIKDEAPQYRHLIKHAAEEVRRVPANLAGEKLDVELYRIAKDLEAQTAARVQAFVEAATPAPDDLVWRQQYQEFIDRLTSINEAELARYVKHRKAVLMLLERALQRTPEGAFVREGLVHELVCPKGITSDDSAFANQNLWILDERLTYHEFLGSDVAISRLPVAAGGRERPDIVIFDRPAAFVDGERPFQSVVILEFKKPERASYASEEDPIRQVLGYIDKLRAGGVQDKKGRVIRIDDSARFFCYVIASLTERVKQIAAQRGFDPMMGGVGYFWFNKNYHAYFELIDYDTVLSNAQKRNRVLFEKLGIAK